MKLYDFVFIFAIFANPKINIMIILSYIVYKRLNHKTL